MQGRVSRRNVKRQQRYNKGVSSQEFNRAMKLLDYQNVYESPVMQMQRLREAGLNPNLVYGSSTPAMDRDWETPLL